MDILLRSEKRSDYTKVAFIIEEAFKTEAYSNQTEHLLVERLRSSDAFIPELSIVAELNGELVGHILLTKISIQDGEKLTPSLALAPVSVLPDHQGKSIGGLLIKEAHKVAKYLGYQSVILIGHEDYYPRFGYEPTSKYGIRLPFEAPEKNCMLIELKENALKGVSGTVVYAKAFYG